ncbi:hypothetical protein NP233_g10261 [Leucocoprinus birnbaumii]|uniref:Uncharacterized protein n=1 Tax=Leucocoprinus birnbaumii TaxID=56174 RepID=A0AAD5VIL3_9AGAR|nr:hypothetical protein NP233_g10261 [Leucocoprinus birnbaumii]
MPPESVSNSHSAPSAGDELSALASPRDSRNASPQASLPRPKTTRKPVPSLASTPVAFPAENPSHIDNSISFSSQRQPGLSPTSPHKRTMSFPSPSLPHTQRLNALTDFTGQPATSTAASASTSPTIPSSLSRNSSVPASLSHNTPSTSNLPARPSTATHNRPSLSSPSPPTPIVPSIPLRHATQHSPVKPASSAPHTPPYAHTTYPRGSLDRHPPSVKPHPEHSPNFPSFATSNASDPNISSLTSTSPEQVNYYTLPLKQLLAKPAIPSQFHSGSESASDGGGSSSQLRFSTAHRRSTSDFSLSQYAAPRRNSDISVVELAAIRALQPRNTPFVVPKSKSSSVIRDAKSYHYRRTGESVSRDDDVAGGKKERKVKVQVIEGSGWWPDWKQDEERDESDKKEKGKDRNLLRRRPSNSTKPSPELSQASSGSRLSRSLSASSLLKRAGLFTSLNPSIRSTSPLPPKPSSSDTTGIQVTTRIDRSFNSHGNRTSTLLDNVQHSHDEPKLIVPSAGLPEISPSPVSKQAKSFSATQSSTRPPERQRPFDRTNANPNTTRLSTISSGSSGAQSRDSKILSPAGAVADAYKREQRARDLAEEEADAAVIIAPIRPPRPPQTPELPPTVGDPEISPQLPLPSQITSPVWASGSNTKKHEATASSSSGGLSYVEALNNKVDVAEKADRLSGEMSSGVLEEAGVIQQQLRERASFGEAVGKGPNLDPEERRSSLAQSPPPLRPPRTSFSPSRMDPPSYSTRGMSSRTSSPLASPPLSPPPMSPPPSASSQRPPVKSNKLRKSRHASEQPDSTHTPYYTVVGTRSDQVFSVGGPRDSFGAGFSDAEKATWGVTTTITVGADNEEKSTSIGKSLTRKMSGRFIKQKEGEKSPELLKESATIGGRGRASTINESAKKRPGSARGGGVPVTASKSVSPKATTYPEGELDDRCFPSLYSLKKQAQSEMELSVKEREREKEKESSGVLPKLWKLFGGRSKSRERNEEEEPRHRHSHKTDRPPPLPALPKHYVSALNDIYTPIYARQEQKSNSSSPRTSHKSPGRSRSAKASPTTPPTRPSTATTPSRSSTSDVPYWSQRSHSAGSSVTSLHEVPPMPSPLPDLKKYTSSDEVDSRSKPKSPMNPAAQSPRTIHATNTEGVNTQTVSERPGSPSIPLFSTAEPINSFPPRRSSDQRSKNSPISDESPPSPSNLTPNSPPPRPARSPQRPSPQILVHSRTNSFSDEALYPPVMKSNNASTRSIPKMTFREIDGAGEKNAPRKRLTEQEKADRWDALLEKSDAAGGTLHFAGGDDKLPSDELRFSRTLSELARDDESVSASVI